MTEAEQERAPVVADEKKGPRRRVVLELKAGADSWDDLRGLFRHLETELAMHGKLSSCVVSGGYSSGFTMTSNEDESITHDSWAAKLGAYCASLADRERGDHLKGVE